MYAPTMMVLHVSTASTTSFLFCDKRLNDDGAFMPRLTIVRQMVGGRFKFKYKISKMSYTGIGIQFLMKIDYKKKRRKWT